MKPSLLEWPKSGRGGPSVEAEFHLGLFAMSGSFLFLVERSVEAELVKKVDPHTDTLQV